MLICYAYMLYVLVYCNSMTALGYTKDLKYHGRAKYIDIRHYGTGHVIA